MSDLKQSTIQMTANALAGTLDDIWFASGGTTERPFDFQETLILVAANFQRIKTLESQLSSLSEQLGASQAENTQQRLLVTELRIRLNDPAVPIPEHPEMARLREQLAASQRELMRVCEKAGDDIAVVEAELNFERSRHDGHAD